MTNFGMQGICMLGLLRAGGGFLLSTHTAELILYPLSIPKKGKKEVKVQIINRLSYSNYGRSA